MHKNDQSNQNQVTDQVDGTLDRDQLSGRYFKCRLRTSKGSQYLQVQP